LCSPDAVLVTRYFTPPRAGIGRLLLAAEGRVVCVLVVIILNCTVSKRFEPYSVLALLFRFYCSIKFSSTLTTQIIIRYIRMLYPSC
jgi:hypothetical protein